MRLIDADKLKKTLHNFFDGKVIYEPAYILRDVFCYIDNAPTVERPHGKWIYKCCYGDEFPQCSVCGKINDIKTKFCPYCGSKNMRSDEDGK